MKVLMIVISVFLTSCSTMNSNFSCNITAGDSCLTIEQVDAMTAFADDRTPKRLMKAESHHSNPQGKLIKQANGQSLWLAQNIKEESWA